MCFPLTDYVVILPQNNLRPQGPVIGLPKVQVLGARIITDDANHKRHLIAVRARSMATEPVGIVNRIKRAACKRLESLRKVFDTRTW